MANEIHISFKKEGISLFFLFMQLLLARLAEGQNPPVLGESPRSSQLLSAFELGLEESCPSEFSIDGCDVTIT